MNDTPTWDALYGQAMQDAPRYPKPPLPPAPGAAERLRLAVDKLMQIVEGTRYRRWSADGKRLTDTPEWCELYCAWCAIKFPPNTKLCRDGGDKTV